MLDRFDGTLEEAARHEPEADPTSCIFMCPKLEDSVVRSLAMFVRWTGAGCSLCGYGLGGFRVLVLLGSSGFLSSLLSSTFTLPLYCITAFALEI